MGDSESKAGAFRTKPSDLQSSQVYAEQVAGAATWAYAEIVLTVHAMQQWQEHIFSCGRTGGQGR